MEVEEGPAASFKTPVLYSDVLFGEWQLEKTIHFMEKTHTPICVAVTVSYLIMVYYGPKYMASRKAYDLRRCLAVWNICLSAYSAFSFYKLLPEVIGSLRRRGMIGTLCYNDDLYSNKTYGYWTWLYVMSKGPELIDTVFLILRKRPVIFMHWYHHSVTFCAATLYFTELVPWARWGIIINLVVHTIMYFYYGVRAAGFSTPQGVSKMITTMQITQFTSGFYFVGRVLYMHFTNEVPDCQAKLNRMGLGTVILITYLYLFCQYFHRTYIKNDSPTKNKNGTQESESNLMGKQRKQQ